MKIWKILNENFSEIAFAATQSLSAWLQWNAIKCEITFEACATHNSNDRRRAA